MQIGNYKKYGYSLHRNFFKEEEIAIIEPILIKFHNSWLKEHARHYANGTLNSHSLTSSKYINNTEKKTLFDFIAQNKLYSLLEKLIPQQAKFLNTQLFFDPKNANQENYWHRDIQYTGKSEEEQKQAIKTQNVLHFRIPLKTELGIELIPQTHRRWDSKEEYEVRKSLNNKKTSDELKNSKRFALKRKDLLIFSANMIHRGIYGKERFSFDIIYCDDNPSILKFRDIKNLPPSNEIAKRTNIRLF